jgi:hypothetical protein
MKKICRLYPLSPLRPQHRPRSQKLVACSMSEVSINSLFVRG